jgi:hypothetical protein
MKIHNNQPVSGKTIRKTSRSGNSGTVFGTMLESEIGQLQPAGSAVDEQPQPQQQSTAEAWQALEESVTLLDQAMQSIEAGDAPSPQLIRDIEQLRGLLRQQVSSGSATTSELKQADTLLAVEAERIRSMQG